MKKSICIILIYLFATISIFSSIVNTTGISGNASVNSYYSTGSLGSGSFGFFLKIKSETSFWISKTSDIDIEETEKSLAYTTSVQEIALLILETRARKTFNFSISHSKLFMDGDSSKPYIDYNLIFNDGNYSYDEDDSGTIEYSYIKSNSSNMKRSLGSFNVKLHNLDSSSSGNYESIITVTMTEE